MKHTQNTPWGFTLIELLVVLIIVGLLAAIALPQYNKAVERARVAQVVSAMHTIALAEEHYYLTNGQYTDNQNELAIKATWPRNWRIRVNTLSVWATPIPDKGYSLNFCLQHAKECPLKAPYCWASAHWPSALQFCEMIGKNCETDKAGYKTCLL